jgi:predicted metal-dependent phosphoesterase TrpH
MAKVDLHVHSTRSDGTLTPTELIRLCSEKGLEVVALTDHDSTDGIAEARAEARLLGDLEVIAGVELSCDTEIGEVHVLGLFVDTEAPDFQKFCARTRNGRLERGRLMVERLAESGVKLSFERVLELSDGGAVGRPHVARALVEAGYVNNTKEAFDTYLGTGGSGFVPRRRLTPRDAVELLVSNGALPVLAHPLVSPVKAGRKEIGQLDETLADLKSAGLVGLEVYYADYTPEQTGRLQRLAHEHGLVPCGGTDFHNSGTPGEPTPGSVGPPMESVQALKRLKQDRDAAVRTK